MRAPLAAVREALAGQDAWLVGGAVRDRLLGRTLDDLDIAVAGDPAAAASAVRRATGGARFPLSEEFGAWRVVGPEQAWQVDVLPLTGGTLESDLAARDFTINAMAQPLAADEVIDPHGGQGDLAARRLRVVSERSLADDPLRTLRAVRLAVELDLEIEPETLAAVREHAPRLTDVAPERIFTELRRVVGAPAPAAAMRRLEDAGVTVAVLPELLPMQGVDQNVFHHVDVYGHTLAVLDAVAALERDPSPLGPRAGEVAARLAEPLADGLTRWQSMRFAALLHDVAKPQTRGELADGRVTFIGHDAEGADVARGVLRRLRTAGRLVDHVAALTLHHLRLGFLVHEEPLSRRSIHRYLRATAPFELDVTVFTVADRLATRGRNADAAIAAHLEVAQEMIAHALDSEPVAPLVRGDELARELGIRPGPELGELLAQLEEDRFAGEITTREDAVRRARELVSRPS